MLMPLSRKCCTIPIAESCDSLLREYLLLRHNQSLGGYCTAHLRSIALEMVTGEMLCVRHRIHSFLLIVLKKAWRLASVKVLESAAFTGELCLATAPDTHETHPLHLGLSTDGAAARAVDHRAYNPWSDA